MLLLPLSLLLQLLPLLPFPTLVLLMLLLLLRLLLLLQLPFRSVPFRSVPFRSAPFRSVPFRSDLAVAVVFPHFSLPRSFPRCLPSLPALFFASRICYAVGFFTAYFLGAVSVAASRAPAANSHSFSDNSKVSGSLYFSDSSSSLFSPEPLAIFFRKPNITNTITVDIGNVTTTTTTSLTTTSTTTKRFDPFPKFVSPRCSGRSRFSSASDPFTSEETPNGKRPAPDLSFSGSSSKVLIAPPFLCRIYFSANSKIYFRSKKAVL
jgi:hypothetical protein